MKSNAVILTCDEIYSIKTTVVFFKILKSIRGQNIHSALLLRPSFMFLYGYGHCTPGAITGAVSPRIKVLGLQKFVKQC